MEIQENVLIDTIVFNPPLPMEYDKVIWMLSSYHSRDCCENHYLDFEWKWPEFETAKQFLSKVDKIEISWVPWMWISLRMFDSTKEFPFFIPWRAENNGYYSNNLALIVTLQNWLKKEYDISLFQDNSYYDL